MRSSLPTLKEVNCCLNSAEAAIETLENFSRGEVTLDGETLVADTRVTASTVVVFNRHTGSGTLGHLEYSVKAGVGVTFISDEATEESTLTYIIYY